MGRTTESVDAPHPTRRCDRSVLESTVREHNEVGADAAALECSRIRELGHSADLQGKRILRKGLLREPFSVLETCVVHFINTATWNRRASRLRARGENIPLRPLRPCPRQPQGLRYETHPRRRTTTPGKPGKVFSDEDRPACVPREVPRPLRAGPVQKPLLPARRLGGHRGARSDPAARGTVPPLRPSGGGESFPLVRRDGGGSRLPERHGGRNQRDRRFLRILPPGPRLLPAEGGARPGAARMGGQAALLHHVPAGGLGGGADGPRADGRGVVPDGREPDPPDPRIGGEGSGPPLPRRGRAKTPRREWRPGKEIYRCVTRSMISRPT